jgi:hypothetical protein
MNPIQRNNMTTILANTLFTDQYKYGNRFDHGNMLHCDFGLLRSNCSMATTPPKKIQGSMDERNPVRPTL